MVIQLCNHQQNRHVSQKKIKMKNNLQLFDENMKKYIYVDLNIFVSMYIFWYNLL